MVVRSWPSLALVAAHGLTVARVATTPVFVLFLVAADRVGSRPWGASLLALYAFIALSDLLDGPLARRAGAPSPGWGRADAAADIVFNTLSLAAAAWLGRVGPWVPAGVAVLGGRFLLGSLQEPRGSGPGLREDRAGKAAGVVYYLLVLAVAVEVALPGTGGRWWIARAGDLVFAYTLFVLLWKAMASRRARSLPNRSR